MKDEAEVETADISNDDILKLFRHHASLFRQVDEILAVLVTGLADIAGRLDIVERVLAALAVQYPIDADTVAEILAKQAAAEADTETPLKWIPPTGQYL